MARTLQSPGPGPDPPSARPGPLSSWAPAASASLCLSFLLSKMSESRVCLAGCEVAERSDPVGGQAMVLRNPVFGADRVGPTVAGEAAARVAQGPPLWGRAGGFLPSGVAT